MEVTIGWGYMRMFKLVGYGGSNNRLRVYEKVDWMVCHSDFKHLPKGALLSIHQFFELVQ